MRRADPLLYLKLILHDWEDDDAAAILRSCRRAMTLTGTLLIMEHEIAGPNEGPRGKFVDLTMLVHPGGRERTHDQWESLLASARSLI